MYINSYNPKYSNKNNYQVFKAGATVPKNVAKKMFKKTYNRSTSWLALGIGKLAEAKPVQKLVDFLKDKNYQEHLAAFTGCVLSGFYMLDTAKSKNIEKDQKFPLIMNQAVVCALSTVGAYTLTHYLNKKLNHVTELFSISKIEDKALQDEFLKCKTDYTYINELKKQSESNPALKPIFSDLEKKFEFTNNTKVYLKEELKKHKDDETAKEFLKEIKKVTKTADKEKADVVKELFFKKMKNSKAMQATFDRESMNIAISKLAAGKNAGKLPNMINGFRTAKALVIFALIYRFVSPVFATPLANSISGKIEANKKKKLEQKI